MSEGDQAVHVIYLLGCLILVVSALAVRRTSVAQGLKMFIGWVLIFAAGFIIFTFKDEFLHLGDRLLVEARGGVVAQEAPGEVRVRQSADGHFWVEAELNGEPVRFMIDSGATVTSLSREAAERAGVEPRGGLRAMVRTANGVVMVDRARAQSLRVGPIERRNLPVHVSDAFGDMNVLGMNFLNTLNGWTVEGRTMILRTGDAADRERPARRAADAVTARESAPSR